MHTASATAVRPSSPSLLVVAALLAIGAGGILAQPGEPTALPLRGVTLSQQAPHQTSAFRIELPQGARLVLKARGSASAPSLELLGPDGASLALEPVSRGRMTTLRGLTAGASGSYTVLLTDGGLGGQLVLRTRTSWPGRSSAPLLDGLATLPLFSPGGLPVRLSVRAPKGSLVSGLTLLALLGPDGEALPTGGLALRRSRDGHLLRIGPVLLPAGSARVLLGAVPAPGTPVPELELHERVRFSRSARLR